MGEVSVNAKYYTIQVTVDGDDIDGGKYHTYYVCRKAYPVIFKDFTLKSSYLRHEYHYNTYVSISFDVTTNSDLTIYTTYKRKVFFVKSTKTTPKKNISIGTLTRDEIQNGKYVSMTYHYDLDYDKYFAYEEPVYVHILDRNGVEVFKKGIRIDESSDSTTPTTPTVGTSLACEIDYLTVNGILESPSTLGETFTTSIAPYCPLPSININFKNVNKNFYILETYTNDNNQEMFNITPLHYNSSSVNAFTSNLCIQKEISTAEGPGNCSSFTRKYIMISNEAYRNLDRIDMEKTMFDLSVDSKEIQTLFSVKYQYSNN